MKALTIRQPWAHLIIYGGKNVENRKRITHHRGPLVIHAAKTCDDLGPVTIGGRHIEVPADLAFGALIGVVQLTGCVKMPRNWGRGTRTPNGGTVVPTANQWRAHHSAWAEPGMWHWLLSYPRPFAEPVPWRGMPGLFEVPDSVVEAALEGREGAAMMPDANNLQTTRARLRDVPDRELRGWRARAEDGLRRASDTSDKPDFVQAVAFSEMIRLIKEECARRMLATIEEDAADCNVLYVGANGEDVTVGTLRAWAALIAERGE